jgi:hypothetical protein
MEQELTFLEGIAEDGRKGTSVGVWKLEEPGRIA